MVKLVLFAPCLLLLVDGQVQATPIIIQPLSLRQGQDLASTTSQKDNINSEGIIDIRLTEAPLFGPKVVPLTHDELERLQHYASDLEGQTIIFDRVDDTFRVISTPSVHSVLTSVINGIGSAKEALHSVSIKLSSFWKSIPFSHQKEALVVEEDGLGEGGQTNYQVDGAFQDDANYPITDFIFSDIEGVADFERFERVLEKVIQSHTQPSPLEPSTGGDRDPFNVDEEMKEVRFERKFNIDKNSPA